MDTNSSEVEAIRAHPRRRLRKPSAKAQQSEEKTYSIDAALLSSDDQSGGAAQPAVINEAQTRKNGGRGGRGAVGQTTVQTMQDQMEEQTSILITLPEAWMKQEAYNKALEAEVGLIKQELQAVKNFKQSRMNCAGLNRRWQMASQPLPPHRTVLGCHMLPSGVPRQSVPQAM
jgi:hypothetical protein